MECTISSLVHNMPYIITTALALAYRMLSITYYSFRDIGASSLHNLKRAAKEISTFPVFCVSCKCIGHLSGDCYPPQVVPPNAAAVPPIQLNVNVYGEGNKMDNSVSCVARDGVPTVCPENENVLVCDNTVSIVVDEVNNAISNFPKNSDVNVAVDVASMPVLPLVAYMVFLTLVLMRWLLRMYIPLFRL
ncbi:hypothetical protein KFK09_016793 [Dendrobium nobile]|uniref:Uncharacterized protein n=1 Tax=Dendrobium nobile TaxID=94219 RepID=A0A8T3B117_DENNO|nr:hypothetical protein KFK09_016793 [Dendrobium nobile]